MYKRQVLFLNNFWIISFNSYSLSASSEELASSKIKIFEFFKKALAIAILCISPLDRCIPQEPIIVFSLFSNLSKIFLQPAWYRAVNTSSLLAFLLAICTLSKMLKLLNNLGFWKTKEIFFVKQDFEYSEISILSIKILPEEIL